MFEKEIGSSQWFDVDMSKLEYNGLQLYPDAIKVQVKEVSSDLVNKFLEIDETDKMILARQVDAAMEYAIKTHVRIIKGGSKASGLKCYRHDRFRLVMLIREMNGYDTKISSKQLCGDNVVDADVNSSTLIYQPLHAKIVSSWNESGWFDIKTKQFGTYRYLPVTMEMDRNFETYRQKQEKDSPLFVKERSNFMRLLPLLNTGVEPSDITFTMSKLFNRYLKLSQQERQRMSFIANETKISATTNIKCTCETCRGSEEPTTLVNKWDTKISNFFTKLTDENGETIELKLDNILL